MKRLAALGFVVGFLLVVLSGCNDAGKACSQKGAQEWKSNGEHHVCVIGPHGGLEWQ